MSEDFISGLHDDLVEAMDRYERRSPRGRLAAGGYPHLLRPATLARVAASAALIVALVAVVVTVAREADIERPAAPSGKKVVATDGGAGIRFSLDGRVLTVRLLSKRVVNYERVSGARISATCGANVGPPADPRRETTVTRLWPAGQTSLSYRFPRDVSRWCRLEEQSGTVFAIVWFGSRGAKEQLCPELRGSRSARETANDWARLFAASCPGYMAQPALEQMYCQRDERPIPNCTRPTRAYRQSFRDATVLKIAIKGDRAAARFSNGETIELGSTDPGWVVDKFGENAGRGFFK